jgi:hypothetical protein
MEVIDYMSTAFAVINIAIAFRKENIHSTLGWAVVLIQTIRLLPFMA